MSPPQFPAFAHSTPSPGLVRLPKIDCVKIVVNDVEREVTEGITVAQLLTELEMTGRHLAVEVNLELVPRARHADHVLHAGDRLEIVTFVGGG